VIEIGFGAHGRGRLGRFRRLGDNDLRFLGGADRDCLGGGRCRGGRCGGGGGGGSRRCGIGGSRRCGRGCVGRGRSGGSWGVRRRGRGR
jgi:hypothetical protein